MQITGEVEVTYCYLQEIIQILDYCHQSLGYEKFGYSDMCISLFVEHCFYSRYTHTYVYFKQN